jgi:hypothetical protein
MQRQVIAKNATSPQTLRGMNITGVTGLTDAQKATLKALGAVELEDSLIQ